MDRSDLPDMYAQARGRATPEGKCGHIRQKNHDRSCYICYVTLWASEKLLCII